MKTILFTLIALLRISSLSAQVNKSKTTQNTKVVSKDNVQQSNSAVVNSNRNDLSGTDIIVTTNQKPSTNTSSDDNNLPQAAANPAKETDNASKNSDATKSGNAPSKKNASVTTVTSP